MPNPFTKYDIAIGIDCGVNTGFAIWDRNKKRFDEISTMKIHQAIMRIKSMAENGYSMTVFVEDARKATFGRSSDLYKAQGAGSVKRDAGIWEDFLTEHNIPFEMKRPAKSKTKIKADVFKKTTGWDGRTSNHARDAAMIVFGL